MTRSAATTARVARVGLEGLALPRPPPACASRRCCSSNWRRRSAISARNCASLPSIAPSSLSGTFHSIWLIDGSVGMRQRVLAALFFHLDAPVEINRRLLPQVAVYDRHDEQRAHRRHEKTADHRAAQRCVL